MAPGHALTAIDKLLKTIMKNNQAFGGKMLLLGEGLLPVPISCAAFSQTIEHTSLNMNVGNRELSNRHDLGDDIIETSEELRTQTSFDEDIIEISLKPSDVAKLIYGLNEKTLGILEKEKFIFLSVDSLECKDIYGAEHYLVKFLNSLVFSGMPFPRLNCKARAVIML